MNPFGQLEKDGVVVLPGFLQGETLAAMQRAFDARLQRLRWNDFDGYEKTERFRHMVQDVLVLDQGFVDAALHPLVIETLRRYIGDGVALVEAKGWRSLAPRAGYSTAGMPTPGMTRKRSPSSPAK